MATNPYFNNYTETSEQDLVEVNIIEAIQMRGFDVKYLPRTLVDFDYLYGEDPSSAFVSATEIEMYPTFVERFGGEGDMITFLGTMFKDTGTFVVSKSRFSEELIDLDKPEVGDLIFVPLTKSFLEVTHVTEESPFFELGKNYVWEVKTESFEFSYEDFNTGDAEVDTLIDDLVDFDPETQTEDYGDNQEIQDEADDIVDFDPSNPFGVR